MEALCTTNGLFSSSRSVVSACFLQNRSRARVCTRRPTSRIALRTRAAVVGDGTKESCQASAQLQGASEQAAKLKADLFKAIDEAKEGLDDKCLAIITSLEQLGHVPGVATNPHLLKGRLVGLKANFRENRRDNKKRYLGYSGARTTLGATTFNALKPADLQIALYEGQQLVATENPDSYLLTIDVAVIDPLSNEPSLVGEITNRAKFSFGESYTLQIEFLASEIKPKFPEKDLNAWLSVFKEANPGMDEKGFVSVPYPKPINGWTDIIYMDDEIRIHRGHKGGVSVLQVLKEPI